MNRYGLVIIAVAVALLAAVAWKPAQQYVGLRSLLPDQAATPTPTPTPAATQEPAAPTSTPALPPPRFEKCVDGSALTVTGVSDDWINYKCGSGAEGSYLK
jgi:hypothetical protein